MRRILKEKHLENFRKYLTEEDKSPLTIEKYLRDVKKFSAFAEKRPLTREVTSAYRTYLQTEGYRDRSVNSMIASVNSLLAFLEWSDLKIKSLRVQRQTYCRKQLEKEEYMRLLRAAGEDRRLNLMMQTIASTGIRISELSYFTVEAVRQGEVWVRCKGKGRKILIPATIRKMLLAYAKETKIKEGIIFRTKTGKAINRSTVWRQMKRLCNKAKVEEEKTFPHNLRKLFARMFYRLEKDIAKLADLLGHGSIETTRIYIMETGEEHRRKIEKLGLVMPTGVRA